MVPTGTASPADLLIALDRLFGIGVLYPPGHARCVEVALAFQREMAGLLDGSPTLVCEGHRTALTVQGCPVPLGTRGARRLHGILAGLGIARLEIDAGASALDLQELTRLLHRWKHDADATRGFRQLDLTGLPSTARIVQREFSHRADDDDPDPESDQVREVFRHTLPKITLSEREPVAVRRELERPPETAAETAPSANLAAPFAPPTPGEERDRTSSAIELRHRLEALANSADRTVIAPAADRAEQLAVLLQLLLTTPDAAARAVIENRLREELPERPRRRERAVLLGALQKVLASGDAAAVDRLWPLLTPSLRRQTPLGPLLLEVCRALPPASRSAIWPQVTNEILGGMEGEDVDTLRELSAWAGSLPEDAMRPELARLERLPALREGAIARRLFQPPLAELRPVFAALLHGSRGETIAALLLEGLRAQPPPWPGAPALAFLRAQTARHRAFLAQWLRESGHDTHSPDLLATAGAIVGAGLRSLPRRQRHEPWVSEAVSSLGALPVAGAAELLTRIRREKRWRLLPAWPGPCRRAAADAARRLAARLASDAPPPPAPPPPAAPAPFAALPPPVTGGHEIEPAGVAPAASAGKRPGGE